jgi:hypothetical protein
LNEKIWWDEYYGCLEKKIKDCEKEITDAKNGDELFRREKYEIEMYKKDPLSCRSIYYVLKRK